MNIIVLMKQVPDTEASVEIADSGICLKEDDLKWTVNPYDEFALEEALLIKESRDDVTVTVITVGPDRVTEAIRTAYAMGVDQAIHVNDTIGEEASGGADAHTTARIIAKVLEDIPHDLVIAGNRAVDSDNTMVPVILAKKGGMPLITLVMKQEIDGDAIVCKQSIDGGTAVVRAALPAVITLQKGINEPRYPAFRAIMKAKKKQVDQRELADIGLNGEAVGAAAARTRILSMAYPPERGNGKTIDAAGPAEKAVELVRLLKEEVCVI